MTPSAASDLAFRNGGSARRRTGLLLRAAGLYGAAAIVVVVAVLLLRGVHGLPFLRAAGVSEPAVAKNSTVHASSHRTAVADRMYNGALHRDFLGSLQLLDPEVGVGAAALDPACPGDAVTLSATSPNGGMSNASARS